MSAPCDDVSAFEAQRGALTGLAYRMLGSRADAEDVVQDAYLRWRNIESSTVDEPRRFLATVVARLCLDRIKSARAKHEIYVGQWLPEPVVDEALAIDEAEPLARDISVALMLLLERLSPLERASFLLHDVFGMDFGAVAQALQRGEAACRQLAARARAHIQTDRPRFQASIEDGRRLAAVFQEAMAAGDTGKLAAVLAADAALYSDGGGKRAAPLNPIFGAEKIMRFFDGVARKNPALGGAEARPAVVNGLAGFIIRETDGSMATVAIEHRDGLIVSIYLVRNPEKLQHVRF